MICTGVNLKILNGHTVCTISSCSANALQIIRRRCSERHLACGPVVITAVTCLWCPTVNRLVIRSLRLVDFMFFSICPTSEITIMLYCKNHEIFLLWIPVNCRATRVHVVSNFTIKVCSCTFVGLQQGRRECQLDRFLHTLFTNSLVGNTTGKSHSCHQKKKQILLHNA